MSLRHLSIYVPKKDLEEEVVEQRHPRRPDFNLSKWLAASFPPLTDDLKLPQTLNAKRLWSRFQSI